MLDNGCGRVGRLFGQHEDRSVDPRLAQGDALGDERHAEPFRAGGERRPPDLARTVPVAVGLDDRPHG